MSRKKEIDPEFYETHCLADWLEEADKNGTLIKAVPGKSIIDVARENYLAKKKGETVSVRLPKLLIDTIKQQAKRFSIPWTSYIKEALEADVSRTAKLNVSNKRNAPIKQL
jgi:predicted DNA binding CopG/RHH family protein